MTLFTDEAVEAAARNLCEYGVLTVDGEVATWERHSAKLTQMARVALNGAVAALDTDALVAKAAATLAIRPGAVAVWVCGMVGDEAPEKP